jgi:mannose-6-phosphate isomerase-like protein (cupin superfamily)
MIELARRQTMQEVHLPPSFRRIQIELAREPGHSDGSANFGYLIWAALDSEGKIDAELWKQHRDHFRAVKYRPGNPNEIGHLIHRPGGSWAFHYDIVEDEDDESGFHIENERFVPGEYVSIREENRTRLYKVCAVEHF